MDDSGTSRTARRMGELEGAAFEGALVACERAERSERLSRITLAGDEADLPVVEGSHSRRDRAEIESRLRELSHFHLAVVNSRSWQILQRMRGLFGRAW